MKILKNIELPQISKIQNRVYDDSVLDRLQLFVSNYIFKVNFTIYKL